MKDAGKRLFTEFTFRQTFPLPQSVFDKAIIPAARRKAVSYLFTIHYYFLLPQNRPLKKVKSEW